MFEGLSIQDKVEKEISCFEKKIYTLRDIRYHVSTLTDVQKYLKEKNIDDPEINHALEKILSIFLCHANLEKTRKESN
jgi:hypothetical protein